MHVSLFKLAPTGSRKGITCDADGAFIGTIPLLKRVRENGRDVWVPRDHRSVSKELGACFGLPIDLASKAAGLAAIAHALNAGNIARAQLLTLFLRFPDLAPVLKPNPDRAEVLKFVGRLIESDFIKVNSNRTELAKFNPNHWPAGSPEGPGQFAPKGAGDAVETAGRSSNVADTATGFSEHPTEKGLLDDGIYRPSEEQLSIEQVADRAATRNPKAQAPPAKSEWKPDGILDTILAAVFGVPQNTTHKPLDPHAFASRVVAEHLKRRGAKDVWFHTSLRKISGGAINSSKIPDVAAVAEDGTITPYEILSPGQKPEDMYKKYNGIEARAGSGYRLAKVEVLTREAAWGLPEAAAVAEEGVTAGEVVEGVMRTEQMLNDLNNSVDDEPE